MYLQSMFTARPHSTSRTMVVQMREDVDMPYFVDFVPEPWACTPPMEPSVAFHSFCSYEKLWIQEASPDPKLSLESSLSLDFMVLLLRLSIAEDWF